MTFGAAIPRILAVSLIVLAASPRLTAQLTKRLLPETEQAFDAYVMTAESQMDWKARLRPTASAIAVGAGGSSATVNIHLGMIHDWVAATVVPNGTVEKVLAVLQNYENYKNVYAPDVTASNTLDRAGNRWRVFLQLRKKQVLTVILNSEYTVDYKQAEAGRWSMVSHSTKIAEVEDGRELAPGTGYGFLWRVNVYWLLEPRPEGVYIETRAITLSRDIPAGLAWAIKPMITMVPRKSLQDTLAATARAVSRS